MDVQVRGEKRNRKRREEVRRDEGLKGGNGRNFVEGIKEQGG